MALLESVILRGTRAAQPAATAVAAGTIYGVTDEGNILERSTGAAWQAYSPTASGGTIGGSTGATDNAVLRADGTGGATVQASPLLLSDAGAITFPDGVRQTFNPDATNAGINVGSQAGDPSAPSNGDLVYNSSTPALRARINGAWVSLGAGGAAGNVTTTSAYGSPPGAPASGDLWLPTNSEYLLRYSGAAQVPWGPLYPCVLPIEADYTWDNQDAATSDDAFGPLRLSIAAATGSEVHVFHKSAPATPYTITVLMQPMISNASALAVGIGWRQSSDGKIVAYYMLQDGTLAVDKWTSSSAFSAGYAELGVLRAALSGSVFLRIADDGVNRISSISYDGLYWYAIHTVGRTDFLTADQVGFVLLANNGTTTNIAAMTVLSWAQA